MSSDDPSDFIQILAERAARALIAHTEIDTAGLLGQLAIAARRTIAGLDGSNERAAERAVSQEFLNRLNRCLRSRNDPRIDERLRQLRRKIDLVYPVPH